LKYILWISKRIIHRKYWDWKYKRNNGIEVDKFILKDSLMRYFRGFERNDDLESMPFEDMCDRKSLTKCYTNFDVMEIEYNFK
jgi:hypothetical protein